MPELDGANRFKSRYILPSSETITTSYQLFASGLGGLGYRRVKCINESAQRIAFMLTDSDASTPAASNSSNTNQNYVSATTSEWVDDIHIYDKLYVRSDGGSSITVATPVIFVFA